MHDDRKTKGTSWKRRRGAVVAAVAITALGGLGVGISGHANAAKGGGLTQLPPAASPVATSATGWGG